MKWYAQFIESTAAFLHISHLTLYKIIWSLVIIILFILARIIITRAFEQNITGVGKRYTARKSFTYITGFTALILIAGIWFVGGKNIVAYLGLLSAAIAIALREPIVNFAGWFYLLIRKPFSPGDRIEINAISGDVIDVELFKFSLMELGRREESDMSTGRIIHIPNGYAFRYSIANSTQGFRFIWHEIPVMVSFESNWKKAKEILQDISRCCTDTNEARAQEQIKKAAKRYMIYFKYLTPYVWTKVNDSGVQFTIRYLCDPKRKRSTEMAIWERILEEFAKHNDVQIAYPTRRVYSNRYEGKSSCQRQQLQKPPRQRRKPAKKKK